MVACLLAPFRSVSHSAAGPETFPTQFLSPGCWHTDLSLLVGSLLSALELQPLLVTVLLFLWPALLWQHRLSVEDFHSHPAGVGLSLSPDQAQTWSNRETVETLPSRLSVAAFHSWPGRVQLLLSGE